MPGFAKMQKPNSMMRFVVVFLNILGSHGHTDMNKYIAKNYFDRHHRLIQGEFDSFVANEIPLGLSKVLADKNYAVPTSPSYLRRELTGEGSHRRLSSTIRFKLQSELKSELTARSCDVIIIERLPRGVFADPFELHHLVDSDVLSGAAVFGDTNLELPSFLSNQSVVEIHMSIGSKVLLRSEEDAELNLDLPLHARYPPLGDGFSRVEFVQPDIFICCSLDRHVSDRSCIFMAINDNTSSKSGPVIWDIPCGSKEHAWVVSSVTFGFAILTAVIIVWTSIFSHSGSQGSNMFKHS